MLLTEVVGLEVPLPKCVFTAMPSQGLLGGWAQLHFLSPGSVRAFHVISPSGVRFLSGDSGFQEPWVEAA